MDLLSTLHEFEDLVGKARDARKLPLPDRMLSKFVINGVVTTIAHEAPAVDYQACDVDALADHCLAESSAVWHRDNEVVAVLDADVSGFRDDRVTWELLASEKWIALTVNAKTARSHADFVRFLVRYLRDELEASAPGLLGLVRNLKFRSLDEGTGAVQHGKESMGRSIEREISGAEALPETVTIKLRRWAKLEIFVEVECLLILDTERPQAVAGAVGRRGRAGGT